MLKEEYNRLLETLTPLEGLSLNLNLLKHRCQLESQSLTPGQRADLSGVIKNMERTLALVTNTITGLLNKKSGTEPG